MCRYNYTLLLLLLWYCYSKDCGKLNFCGVFLEDMFPGTEWPLRRSTAHRFTEPEDVSSPLYKSTRHLLIPDPPSHRYYYSSRNQDEANSLTSQSLHQFGSGYVHSNNGRSNTCVIILTERSTIVTSHSEPQ